MRELIKTEYFSISCFCSPGPNNASKQRPFLPKGKQEGCEGLQGREGRQAEKRETPLSPPKANVNQM